MVTGIGVALLMAAAAPGATSARVVVAPIAMDPSLRRARLIKPARLYAAPVRLADLRVAARPTTVTRRAPAGDDAPDARRAVPAGDEPRFERLVMTDREAEVTGHKRRKSSLAAGLSLRVTASDDMLLPEFGMTGPVGAALTRIAVEATSSD